MFTLREKPMTKRCQFPLLLPIKVPLELTRLFPTNGNMPHTYSLSQSVNNTSGYKALLKTWLQIKEYQNH